MTTTNLAGKLRVGALESVDPLTVGGRGNFGEVLTAEYTPKIELDSSNGLSTVYRDTTTTTNSGAVSESSDGGFLLSTGTTASSSAELRTKERGRYQPGITAAAGIAVRRPTAPTGNQELTWGYFDDTDGAVFGEDATGIFVQRIHGGTSEDKVYQTDWNGDDKLTGNGGNSNPSQVELDLTKVTSFRVLLDWYGTGPVAMEVKTVDSDGNSVIKVVHRFAAASGEPILEQPKLPITAKADNGGDTTDIDLYVYGRHYGIKGRYDPNRRKTFQDNTGVNTVDSGYTPLVSFKKKTDRESLTKSIKVAAASVITDTDAILAIFLGATLNNDGFGGVTDVSADETALQADTSADGYSAHGTVIQKQTATTQSGRLTDFSGIQSLGVDIPEGTIVSLGIKNISGTGTASAVLGCEEEW